MQIALGKDEEDSFKPNTHEINEVIKKLKIIFKIVSQRRLCFIFYE